MGVAIPLVLLLLILCFACARVGYDVADKRAQKAEKHVAKLKNEITEYQNLLATERLRYEAERQKRVKDVEDYNELVDKYNTLYRQYQNMHYGKSTSQVNVQSPLVKEMLRFAMTQAHPDAGKEKTPDRFIKYREEYERLYQRRR